MKNAIIAVVNQKDGVGKTTMAQALATGLAERKYEVLSIDLDPQGNFSTACDAVNYNVPTVYEIMKQAAGIREAMMWLRRTSCWLEQSRNFPDWEGAPTEGGSVSTVVGGL